MGIDGFYLEDAELLGELCIVDVCYSLLITASQIT